MQFLKYRLKGYSAHGIHSPFVYNLITNVIYNKTPFYVFEPLEKIRGEYLLSSNEITVEDHGAGSHASLLNRRKIKDIARYSLKSKKYAQLLFRLAEERKCESMLELGTSLGLTTLYLSYARPSSKITTIEGSEQIANIAEAAFKKLKHQNIELIKNRFDQALPEIHEKKKKFDLIFIDGHHEEKACLTYFKALLENNTSENTLMVIDDIHWSPGMLKAWQKIITNEKVTLTIDLFEMGLVYFFPRNQKEHFTIRF